jgi:hypothetical protein
MTEEAGSAEPQFSEEELAKGQQVYEYYKALGEKHDRGPTLPMPEDETKNHFMSESVKEEPGEDHGQT